MTACTTVPNYQSPKLGLSPERGYPPISVNVNGPINSRKGEVRINFPEQGMRLVFPIRRESDGSLEMLPGIHTERIR